LLCYPVPHASAPDLAPAFLFCAPAIINALIYPDLILFHFCFSL
jgi:hypothetical protein